MLHKTKYEPTVSTEEIRAVTDSLRSSVGVSNANSDAVLKIVAASAYLVFLARKNNMNTIDGDIISFVNEYAPEEDIKGFLINELLNTRFTETAICFFNMNMNNLKMWILFTERFLSNKIKSSDSETTPDGVCDLARGILDVQDADSLCDVGCGTGKFIIEAFAASPEAAFTGFEIKSDAAAIAKIRADVLGGNITIVNEDIMTRQSDADKFDKIFANLPIGARLREFASASDFINLYNEKIPKISGASSSDMVFILRVMEMLKAGGKAIYLTTNNCLFSSADRPIREYMIRCGYVEAVISLPERLLESTAAQISLLILSHGNKDIRFVDASNIRHQNRRMNVLEKDDVKQILDELKTSPAKNIVDFETIRKSGFKLTIGSYMEQPAEYDSIRLGDAAVICRGAQFPAAYLDDKSSLTPTNNKYLAVGNIKEGMIDDASMLNLTGIDARYEKSCLKNKNIVISKFGIPAFKTAIIDKDDDIKILASSNLYILDIDETKIDPYYVEAFLESGMGMEIMGQMVVGTSPKLLSLEALKNLPIPKADIVRQKEIAAHYKNRTAKIKELKAQILEESKSINDLFNE